MSESLVQRTPSPIDVHVGSRIRSRRKTLGMSQEGLATQMRLTFQQIQKYERGSNRISAPKLWEAAQALGVSVGYFFEGLEQAGGEVVRSDPEMQFFMADGATKLADDYLKLPKPQQQVVTNLARDLCRATGVH